MKRVITYIGRSARRSVNIIMSAASLEHRSIFHRCLRQVLFLSPTIRALLLYLAGFIQKAKSITDKRKFANANLQRVVRRIDAIYLALTDWDSFKKQVGVPDRSIAYQPFNLQVLMVVNSCGAFDSNGYAVRSMQIGKSLEAESVNVNFCARLGYPWDMRGREHWSVCGEVASDEGQVWLQHDAAWLVGESDIVYWNAYAEHIKCVVTRLRNRPSILHAHSKYSNGIAATIAGRQLGIPVVYEMRGLWHLTRAQREPTFYKSDTYNYEERLEIWAAEIADAVVVISSTLKTWLVDRGYTSQ